MHMHSGTSSLGRPSWGVWETLPGTQPETQGGAEAVAIASAEQVGSDQGIIFFLPVP